MYVYKYIPPEIVPLRVGVEHGFGASQGSPGIDVGIGGWEEDNNDYNIKKL